MFDRDPLMDRVVAILRSSDNYAAKQLQGDVVSSLQRGASFKQKQDYTKSAKDENFENACFESNLPIVALKYHDEKKAKNYYYKMIEEHNGLIREGQLKVLESVVTNGRRISRILYAYMTEPQEIWVTDDGQVLRQRDLDNGIERILVGSMVEAIGQFDFDRKELTKWYGEVPMGLKNVVSMKQITENNLFPKDLEMPFVYDPNEVDLKLSSTIDKR